MSYKLLDQPYSYKWDYMTQCRWKICQDIKRELGYDAEAGELQSKWRGGWTPTPDVVRDFPVGKPFPSREIELAILDAFANQGGGTVWSGDGSSCAVQIVETIWNLAQRTIKERDEKIALLKECLKS